MKNEQEDQSKLEESEIKDSHKESNPTKAVFSVFGLVVVGVLVFYGLPYLVDSMREVIQEEEDASIELRADTEKEAENDTEKTVEKDRSAFAGNEDAKEVESSKRVHYDRGMVKSKVKESMESAMRPQALADGGFFIDEVKVAKSLAEIIVIFDLDELKREMKFTYSSEYDEYKAHLADEMKQYFSIAPYFSLTE